MGSEQPIVEPIYDEQGNVVPLDDAALGQGHFGGRAAAQVGALVEADFAGERKQAAAEGQERSKTAPQPTDDYRQKLVEMDFDQRVEATLECLGRRPTFRDILYGLLGFCQEEKSYEEIGPFVEGYADFHRNRQEPSRYVFMLLRTGALEEIELDEDGQPLTEERKQAAIDEGLAPEDVDLLVFDWRVVTTEVGAKVFEENDPASRFRRLLAQYPEREEAFAEIMEFCRSPRFMGQIDDEFKGSALLGFDDQTSQMRQPSSYLEKLERSGMIFWNNQHWVLTAEGQEYLDNRDTAAN